MKYIMILILTALHIQAADFTKELEKQLLVMKDSKLEQAGVDLSGKQLFVVYYSNRDCGICVQYTKMLNDWFKKKAPEMSKVQIIFATRGEENRDLLTKYILKSKIEYPVLDEKHFVEADIDGTGSHPFYMDADMGVPRLRFFDRNGKEISIKKHVKSIYDPKEVFPKLNEIIGKLIK